MSDEEIALLQGVSKEEYKEMIRIEGLTDKEKLKEAYTKHFKKMGYLGT
jgi:hypothetical protein